MKTISKNLRKFPKELDLDIKVMYAQCQRQGFVGDERDFYIWLLRQGLTEVKNELKRNP